jgi:hypothetical protein
MHCFLLGIKHWTDRFLAHEQILQAFLLEDPSESTPAQQHAMEFFLNTALASVDLLLVKKWIPGSTTHISHFGKSYPFNVALAFNLTSKFSNPANVLHNAGILDESGKLLPKNAQLSPPKKKYHKKTVKKKLGREIESDYYKHIHIVTTEFSKPGFACLMEWWDRKLCNKRTSNTS